MPAGTRECEIAGLVLMHCCRTIGTFPKHDSIVRIVGYAWCAELMGMARRSALAVQHLRFLLSRVLLVYGQGINIKIPLPVIDDILNSDDDEDLEHRWWFWLVIGIISAFFVVGILFTIRGFYRYRISQRDRGDADLESNVQHAGALGRRLSAQFIYDLSKTSQTEAETSQKMCSKSYRDSLANRTAIVNSQSCTRAMIPKGTCLTSDIYKQNLLRKINPRVVSEEANDEQFE